MNERPLILLTNDDGVNAPGIAAAREVLGDLGEVIVAAPDRERSASSHSISLDRPLRVDEVEAAWRWTDSILDSWSQLNVPARPYTAGSWGPSAAIALIERDGRTWHEDDA